MSRTRWLKELQKTIPFDLALVNEAHYARRKSSENSERTAPRFGQHYTVKYLALPDNFKIPPETWCHSHRRASCFESLVY
jgi:hypothetical protein